MVKKNKSKKKVAGGKRAALRVKPTVRKKVTLRAKSARTKKRTPARKPAAATRLAAREPVPVKGKLVVGRKSVRAPIVPPEITSGSERSSLGEDALKRVPRRPHRDLSEEGGQSGDVQGLSREEEANMESVEELVEEGQAYEADVINGVENAPDADQGPIRTHERPEDDIPPEERSDEV